MAVKQRPTIVVIIAVEQKYIYKIIRSISHEEITTKKCKIHPYFIIRMPEIET